MCVYLTLRENLVEVKVPDRMVGREGGKDWQADRDVGTQSATNEQRPCPYSHKRPPCQTAGLTPSRWVN